MAAFGGRLAGGLSMSSLARHGLSTTSSSLRPLGLTAATQLHLTRNNNNNPVSSVPSQRRPFVNEAVTTVEQLLLAAQANLHIPWYILIPGFGAAISLIFRVPAAKYTQRLAQRRALLKPVLMAWGRRHFHDVNYAKQVDPVRNDFVLRVEIMKRMERTSKRLMKEWGVQPWKQFVPFLAFPGWLVGIEALRRLCDGPVGLLGIFLNKNWKVEAEAATAASKTTETAPQGTLETVIAKAAEATQQAVSQATEAATNAVTEATTTTTTTTTTADTIVNPLANTYLPDSLSAYFQNALPTSMEGCLWFPDLMAADPLHILPFILSFTMFVNVMPRTREGWLRLLNPGTEVAEPNPHNIGDQASQIKVQKSIGLRMQRALLLLTLLVGPATFNLPAALHLYWITTSLTSNAITSVVAAKMPLPPSLGPARGRGDDAYVRPKLPGLDWEPDPTTKKKNHYKQNT
ncbi:hypothetical protein SMACR_06769 [Sordaria macrospora]|uniref:WGS project CABT00000000 data, contig 2.3 n=2 Tax=Sordaria macrospora TaxID=5147 RepID=F7VPY9_SORMK|nr:uncharacterized protein SMAC_06769 [Sordaria macrospora k-hell]KAA8630963.1 hypothetical protein SMACR_06769 [Sordaria macrospora]WPJ64961.1 hypothetical protein SMAC4_06769 [Sordaria macrospora]CCC07567.1 unnamed protein product [Sordaria macrospora k-hell]